MEDSATSQTHSQTRDQQKTKTPCRSFLCARCGVQCDICTHCDRGQIYCPSCAPVAAAARKKRANKRYRVTLRGKHVHAAQEQARRKRRADTGSVGDRGSPSPNGGATFSKSKMSSTEKKENGDDSESSSKNQTDKEHICCSYCGGFAPSFRRQGDIPWRRQAKTGVSHARTQCGLSYGFRN